MENIITCNFRPIQISDDFPLHSQSSPYNTILKLVVHREAVKNYYYVISQCNMQRKSFFFGGGDVEMFDR